MTRNPPNPSTETQLLARALFRGFLMLAKSIAAIYGWSIKDENEQILREQAEPTGKVFRVVKELPRT